MNKKIKTDYRVTLGAAIALSFAESFLFDSLDSPGRGLRPTVVLFGAYALLSLLGSLLSRLSVKQDPALRRLEQERNDERNTMIRDKAKARTGEALTVAMALASTLFLQVQSLGVPEWLGWGLLLTAVLKLILDQLLNLWYQQRM